MSLLRKRTTDASNRRFSHVIPAHAGIHPPSPGFLLPASAGISFAEPAPCLTRGMTARAVLPESPRGIALFILRGAERLLRSARNDTQTSELALATKEVSIPIEYPRIKVDMAPHVLRLLTDQPPQITKGEALSRTLGAPRVEPAGGRKASLRLKVRARLHVALGAQGPSAHSLYERCFAPYFVQLVGARVRSERPDGLCIRGAGHPTLVDLDVGLDRREPAIDERPDFLHGDGD